MLITCTQDNLAKGLSIVSRSVGKDASLPILSNILLETIDGRLKLSTTDLEMGVTVWVGGKVEKEGKITIPARILSEYVLNLPPQKITLTLKGSDLKLESGNFHAEIKGVSAEEFPLIPKIDSEPLCKIDTADMRVALTQTIFAAANDESRPEIAGVFINIDGDKLRIAATDSYRLAEKIIGLKQEVKERKQAIIPSKTLSELARIIGEEDGEISISFSENQVKFTLGGIEVISRLVEGQYPDYLQIIPKEFTSVSEIEAKELADALKATSLFSKAEAADVQFTVNKKNSQLEVSAESGQVGKNITEIPIKTEGKDDTVVLNYRYVLDGLSAVGEPNVNFSTNGDTGPGAITPIKNKGYVYIIMPIKQ